MRRTLLALAALALTACGSEYTPPDPAGLDQDGDGFSPNSGDCNDFAPTIYPGAEELCDGLDNDCDETTAPDEGVGTTWYADADGDGFGDDATSLTACAAPEGYVAAAGDCDDTSARTHPTAPETDCTDPTDYNCDGSVGYADEDGDGFAACEDCDDSAASVNDDADEVCNEVDDDCDRQVDEDAVDAATFYLDADGDGFGNLNVPTAACAAPAGYVTDATDCNDGDATANPAGTEVCDGVDDDCDGTTDEDATDAPTWYADGDGDGFGDEDTTLTQCALPQGYVARAGDCDDARAQTSPVGVELCNERDDDCDGSTDEDDAADASTWYYDGDGDGFGLAEDTTRACSAPTDYVDDATDCDDGSSSIYPGADELCSTTDDDDCDGTANEDDAVDADTWFVDLDGDGFGVDTLTTTACTQPRGYTDDDSDCDDGDDEVNPDAEEVCNLVDDDCDETVDNDEVVLGTGRDCPAIDCLDVLDTLGSASDGTYWIDPDGAGTFQVECDMTTDGGGWTLVGSFHNTDAWNWTRYASGTDNTGNFRNTNTFGSLAKWDQGDFKSPAWWRVEATDLLAQDEFGGWASYDGAMSTDLRSTLNGYSSCQTTALTVSNTSISIDSSNAQMKANSMLVFYGGDPNNSSRCAFNNQVNSTDSSVIGFFGSCCWTAGFGHVGYLSGNGHEDRDHRFCLAGGNPSLTTWYGRTVTNGPTGSCDYASLWVR